MSSKKRYIRVCPKCHSTKIKNQFDPQQGRVVSKCINCLHKGDGLFKEVEAKLVEAKAWARSRGSKHQDPGEKNGQY